jgi:hypothetical protein
MLLLVQTTTMHGGEMTDQTNLAQYDDESTLVEHWSDPARRERYQYYAREKYEFYKSAREWAFKANVEYGKWLLLQVFSFTVVVYTRSMP